MTVTKSLAILNVSAPFAQPNAKDALDIALIMGSYEQETHLYFKGDGVWQLVDKQKPELINVKNFLKTFSAFEFYELDHVYICKESLIERNLTTDFHIENVHVLDNSSFSQSLRQHHVVLKF